MVSMPFRRSRFCVTSHSLNSSGERVCSAIGQPIAHGSIILELDPEHEIDDLNRFNNRVVFEY